MAAHTDEAQDDGLHDTRGRAGNAPGTQDPADAPADIGAERSGGSDTQPDTGAGRGRGSGVYADPEVIGKEPEMEAPRISTGDAVTEADRPGPQGSSGNSAG